MPRIIVNSIPKSGTHLVERALCLLRVSRKKPLFLSSATSGEFPADGGETVPVGVGMPVEISARLLRQALLELCDGRVVTAHVPYSGGMEQILREVGYRMILVARDPRDVAVSLAHHISREEAHRLHHAFAALSPEQRIMKAITGCEQLEDVGQRFASVLPWVDCDFCLLVRFEDLVGARGGGSDQRQRTALEAISRHIVVEDGDLSAVQRDLFGSSATFRKGTIEQWREQFTAAHHEALGRVAGDLLQRLGYS